MQVTRFLASVASGVVVLGLHVFHIGCSHEHIEVPAPAPPRAVATSAGTNNVPALPTEPDVSQVVAEFRRSNKSRIIHGIPHESLLDDHARDAWCQRLTPLARSRISQSGDNVGDSSACAISLLPAASRRKVAGVRVVFDIELFFRMPYAAASYDRESRTLFLPLDALLKDWSEVTATKHEWLHAEIHRRALAGDAFSVALQTQASGPEYQPDAFNVDEIPASLCDLASVLDRGAFPEAWQMTMATSYIDILGGLLLKLRELAQPLPEVRAGVGGLRFSLENGVTTWLGGPTPRPCLAILEAIHRDAKSALQSLALRPSQTLAARAVPLLAATCPSLPVGTP